MIRKSTRWWKVSAAVLGTMAVALVAVAAQVSPPNTGAGSEPGRATSANGTAGQSNSGAQWVNGSDNQPKEVQVDPAIYDNYVGHYQLGEVMAMGVTRDGQHLFTRVTGQGPVEIFPSSETQFFAKVVKAQITFVIDASGRATALTIAQNGKVVTAPRMDDQVAQQMADRLSSRVQAQTPQPGSEAALRKLIGGLMSGKPDYDAMTPELAKVTREQLPQLQPGLQHQGAVRSVEFRGVGVGGWDVYDVHHEIGITTWRLALNSEGKIAGALVQSGP